MGRTNPTYRDALADVEADWQDFRRGLRREYKPDFDRLFDHARTHADAAGYQNTREPMDALLVSILLAHEHELQHLQEQVE